MSNPFSFGISSLRSIALAAFCAPLLVGCGADIAATAATTAPLQAAAARSAQATIGVATRSLDAAAGAPDATAGDPSKGTPAALGKAFEKAAQADANRAAAAIEAQTNGGEPAEPAK